MGGCRLVSLLLAAATVSLSNRPENDWTDRQATTTCESLNKIVQFIVLLLIGL